MGKEPQQAWSRWEEKRALRGSKDVGEMDSVGSWWGSLFWPSQGRGQRSLLTCWGWSASKGPAAGMWHQRVSPEVSAPWGRSSLPGKQELPSYKGWRRWRGQWPILSREGAGEFPLAPCWVSLCVTHLEFFRSLASRPEEGWDSELTHRHHPTTKSTVWWRRWIKGYFSQLVFSHIFLLFFLNLY
jgi:hypothetical protein